MFDHEPHEGGKTLSAEQQAPFLWFVWFVVNLNGADAPMRLTGLCAPCQPRPTIASAFRVAADRRADQSAIRASIAASSASAGT